METYHKIQTLFKRDMDGTLTGKKGKMIHGEWTTPELEYLSDLQWEFTEKVDGTNIRVGINHPYRSAGSNWSKGVEFGGRTDNAVLPTPLVDYLGETFTTEGLRKVFEDLDTPVTLFGEGYGPKIQGGGKYRDDHAFVLFDVKIGDFWLYRKDVDDIAAKLGIESVPTIGYGTLHQGIGRVMGKLTSAWDHFEAEGIVARPVVPLFNRKGERIICKIKAVDFK